MGRGAQAAWTVGGSLLGFLVGLVAGRVATMSMHDDATRATIVLGSTVAGTAAGAGITSYVTSKKLLPA